VNRDKFFGWVSRINSLLFLLLLMTALVLMLIFVRESSRWGNRNSVEVVDQNSEKNDDLRLGRLEDICGTKNKYVKLSSPVKSKGFSSGGYGSRARNVLFFAGQQAEPKWLFDTDSSMIMVMNVLELNSGDCRQRQSIAVYYEVIETDTNMDGVLNEKDDVTIALSTVDGSSYRKILTEITSVLDHQIDLDGKELTVLFQRADSVRVARYSMDSGELISEREISRISKR